MTELNVSIKMLESVWKRILLKLEPLESVSLGEVDSYWTVLRPDCYDMDEDALLSLGSVKDDMIELQKQAIEENDILITNLDIDRFANILLALSINI